jgi:hypothetical protein
MKYTESFYDTEAHNLIRGQTRTDIKTSTYNQLICRSLRRICVLLIETKHKVTFSIACLM